MSALFDIIIGFVAALVSAAFLHFGAAAAPEQPKPAPVTQKQAVPAATPSAAVTPVTETTPLSQPAPTQEGAPRGVAAKSEPVKSEPKRDAAAVNVPVVRVQAVRTEAQTALPSTVAPALPTPPALALPPLPAVSVFRLHVAELSAEDEVTIAREVEKSLRTAERAGALEIAVHGEDAKWVIKAAKAAKASRQAQEDALSGPCPDSHGVPATGQIRTIVAQ
ncbi:hypothetical protein [Asticcacaulis excentricus]|uniref:Uncharacterized protein n=1 Tax=Asticcacaulis excentricus (strain ATCC 15261 / DSM 4724 / KCTC 12464 / NCIMB 9791 / VKM B-1370 / CB 48) TaxID=573065 RepID=E8RKT2_ASTEC|nr:hypothetical protein [Asticcacaulis excentricus]ADU12492.1 hypothetical protein Astex_0808 [Asticcacaulis excentricus CB 48]